MQILKDLFLQNLLSGLKRCPEVQINERQRNDLVNHFELLNHWNKVHNLTSIEKVDSVVIDHYLDCLVALSLCPPHAESAPIYDLGSGNGFPGIIAAILFPQSKIVLVESSRKKCSFLRYSAAQLELKNTEVLQARVESIKNIRYAITRAAFSQNNLNRLAKVFSGGASFYLMTVPSFDACCFAANNPDWAVENQREYMLLSGARRSLVTLRKR